MATSAQSVPCSGRRFSNRLTAGIWTSTPSDASVPTTSQRAVAWRSFVRPVVMPALATSSTARAIARACSTSRSAPSACR